MHARLQWLTERWTTVIHIHSLPLPFLRWCEASNHLSSNHTHTPAPLTSRLSTLCPLDQFVISPLTSASVLKDGLPLSGCIFSPLSYRCLLSIFVHIIVTLNNLSYLFQTVNIHIYHIWQWVQVKNKRNLSPLVRIASIEEFKGAAGFVLLMLLDPTVSVIIVCFSPTCRWL